MNTVDETPVNGETPRTLPTSNRSDWLFKLQNSPLFAAALILGWAAAPTIAVLDNFVQPTAWIEAGSAIDGHPVVKAIVDLSNAPLGQRIWVILPAAAVLITIIATGWAFLRLIRTSNDETAFGESNSRLTISQTAPYGAFLVSIVLIGVAQHTLTGDLGHPVKISQEPLWFVTALMLTNIFVGRLIRAGKPMRDELDQVV